VRRAATAIREANSNDIFLLARRALEAAIRNESDLLALSPPEQSAKLKPHRAAGMSALPRRAETVGTTGHVR
jgi:hypothetical protein